MCRVHTQPMLPHVCLYELGNDQGNPCCGLPRRSRVLPAPACCGAGLGATSARTKQDYKYFTEGCKVLGGAGPHLPQGKSHSRVRVRKGCVHAGLSAFNNLGAQGVIQVRWPYRSSGGCLGLSTQISVPAAWCPQYQPQQRRQGDGHLFKGWCQ